MNREMAALFPSGIKALIVDDDARFIKSSSLLLSLLNFKVTSCGSPASALKLFSEDKIKDVDVVLADAEKATTCGFDFRAIVETDLCLPVIYFLSGDHEATGDEADELLGTLWDSTYVLKNPLEANDVCDLYMVIAWRKCYLENKAKEADRSRAVPAGVQALMAGSDKERENEGRIHFKVVRGDRGRKRKSRSNTGGGSSSGATTVAAGGQQAKRQQGEMNVTGEHERDDMSGQHQPEPKHRGVETKDDGSKTSRFQQPQAMDGRQPGQQQQLPPYNSSIFADAAGRNVGASNTAASATVPAPALPHVNPSPALALSPANSRGNNQQQQQQLFCSSLTFGPFPYQGPRPTVQKKQAAMFLQRSRYGGMPRSRGADESTGGAALGAPAADAGEYGNTASSLLQSLNLGTPQQQHTGHGMAASRAQQAMDDAPNANSCINYSAAAVVASQQVGHGVASKDAATMEEEARDNGDNFSNYYSTSLLAPNQVNELTMAGRAFFSNKAPNADQLAPGALDTDSINGGPLVGSQGPGATMDGDPGLEAMFAPDEYENTMFPLEALLGLDAPLDEAGVDDYPHGGDAGGSAADAARTSLIGAEAGGMTRNWWDIDDNIDMLDDYLFMDGTGDANNGRE